MIVLSLVLGVLCAVAKIMEGDVRQDGVNGNPKERASARKTSKGVEQV